MVKEKKKGEKNECGLQDFFLFFKHCQSNITTNAHPRRRM